MNILMVTFSFYPDGIGGAHSYVYNLAKELIRRGDNVCILTVKTDKNARDREELEGMKIYRYSAVLSGRFSYLRRFFSEVINSRRLYRKLSRQYDFDVINFHSVLPAFGVVFPARPKKKFLVYTFHSSSYKDVLVQSRKKKYSLPWVNQLIFYFLKQVENRALRAAHKIIVLSEFSRKFLIDCYRCDPGKIELVPGGVDSAKFIPCADKAALRMELGIPPGRRVLLTARRLVERMGLENLIAALAIVVREIPDVLLLVLGEGFLRAKLQRQIGALGLDAHVKLLGAIDFQKIPRYYQSADVFILPSEQDEWFGLVTLESLSCGTPVLSTPVGGSLEILRGFDNNLLFSGTSPRDIADGIIGFARGNRYPGGDREKCREFILARYSWNKVADSMQKVYLSGITGRNPKNTAG